ncbi:MAG: FAD binding domain-containing protein [Thermomicrobiales bacterium]|nr:FAD binding domain-containing protein [Thermomicrobiales bacterium]
MALQQVHVPVDLAAAAAHLGRGSSVALLAGGTLLMPFVNTQPSAIAELVSIRRLGLAGASVADGRVSLGAATTLAEVGEDPRLDFLRPTIESIASPPIRNLATVGGNLFARQPYGDLAVALLALDAVVRIAGPDGERIAPVADVLNSGIAPGEIATAVEFDLPPAGGWFYTKAMRRAYNSGAIVVVAAVIEIADGVVAAARVALGGVGPRPARAGAVEAALVGKPLDRPSVEAAAALAADGVDPFTDAYASAWYRARVLPVHVRRAILGE